MVLMHEHILIDVTFPGQFPPGTPDGVITLENVWDIRYHWSKFPGNSRLDQEDIAIRELQALRGTGVGTVVELTPVGLKRNPEGLVRIARAADINIIMGCGYYFEQFLDPGMADKHVDEIAGEIISDLRQGVGPSGIRAGIIGEIGCSGNWSELERRIMKAAVLAQQETGASINVHPHRLPQAPREIVSFIRDEGGDPERTIISHIDRTIFDFPTLFELADTGCVIEYDYFGVESSYYPFQTIDMPNDGMRLKALRALIDRGHIHQILMSHDICTKTRLGCYGGHGYTHIVRNVVHMMLARGFTETEIGAILVDNPRRLLSR
jgi:phosphotriesterase-related protein